MALHYVTGDATAPQRPAPWVIAHVCNDIGRWGRGFVLPLARRWPETKRAFLGRALALGEVQFVELEGGCSVANMIGQRGVYRRGRKDAPIRYEALAQCLTLFGWHVFKTFEILPCLGLLLGRKFLIAGKAFTQCLTRLNDYALARGMSVHMPRIGAGLAGGDWDEIESLLRLHIELARLEVFVYTLA